MLREKGKSDRSKESFSNENEKEPENKESNCQLIDNEMLTLFAENQAMKQKLERWHTIFKLYSFYPPVAEYLDKYNIK